MIYNGHYGHLDDIKTTVRAATEALKPFRDRFEAVVVTGMSGVIVGSPVAIRLGRSLVVVRKQDDSSHDHSDLINRDAVSYGTRYLFLDDFVSAGETYRRIRARMRAWDVQAEYAGSYLYSDNVLSWDGDSDPWAERLRGYVRELSPPPARPSSRFDWRIACNPLDFNVALVEGLAA